MLSEALQRNAKHEARLSNISGYFPTLDLKDNQRSFASLRMTEVLGGYAVALPSSAPNWIPCASGSSVEKLIVFV